MPRFVSRTAHRCGIALLSLALAGLGLGVAWTSWRRGSGSLARGASAYAEGDFRRAAEQARRRLKEAPEDVEALRLLARATARLGRDAPANALFARLGAPALETEDLYLLGFGLDRAGQSEAATRLWEKGLALQADHSETIEQLISRYTRQNRFLEAAQLAERLARLPGKELRGELDLGTFRAELNDPAGAADVLKRALERPLASRLDPSAVIHYRKLLARNLLRIERSAEARTVLERQLEQGLDPEASWLISRAYLQEGAVAAAATALAAAGPHRADHPLEFEPSPYVGESRCAACHRAQSRAVAASGHASTLVRGKPLTELPFPPGPVPDPDDPAVTHSIKREGDKVHYETRVKDKVFQAVVAYAFGSPDHYFSLVGHDDKGQPYIFRLSHYNAGPDSGWARTTGHSPDAAGGQNFLGKPIEVLDGIYKCLFCHATDPRAVLGRSGPAAADRAIGCERCHGPAGNHIRAIEAKLGDPAIVNPAEASAEGRLRVCGQCHSFHQESPLPRTDPFWIRFQGTTTAWSRCYTASGGTFDCMTCHDPHHDTDRSEWHYNERCLTCHAGEPAALTKPQPRSPRARAEPATRGSTCPIDPADGCVGCHMPPYESKPLHASFTDHYIRIHPDLKPKTSQ